MVGIHGLARNGLHLAGLSSFAIAQQYFEPLADGPDFLIEQGMAPLDVGLVRARDGDPPAPRPARARGARRPGRTTRARDGLHLVFIGGLVALIAWQAITEADPGARPLLAYAAAAAGRRRRRVGVRERGGRCGRSRR